MRPPSHGHVEQSNNEDEGQRDDVAQPRFHFGEELVLPCPLEAVAVRQPQLRRDHRFGIVHPATQVTLGLIDVGKHVSHEYAVLVLDHRRPGDDPHVGELAERNGRARLTPLLEEIRPRRGRAHRQLRRGDAGRRRHGARCPAPAHRSHSATTAASALRGAHSGTGRRRTGPGVFSTDLRDAPT